MWVVEILAFPNFYSSSNGYFTENSPPHNFSLLLIIMNKKNEKQRQVMLIEKHVIVNAEFVSPCRSLFFPFSIFFNSNNIFLTNQRQVPILSAWICWHKTQCTEMETFVLGMEKSHILTGVDYLVFHKPSLCCFLYRRPNL